jgi:hypothetical protein
MIGTPDEVIGRIEGRSESMLLLRNHDQQNPTKGRIAVSNRDDELAANPEENFRCNLDGSPSDPPTETDDGQKRNLSLV